MRHNFGGYFFLDPNGELSRQGFKHSIKLVYDFVKKYPKTIVEILPEAAKIKYYSSKQLSIWLSTFRKDWSEELPSAYLAKLLEDNPIIKKVSTLFNKFLQLPESFFYFREVLLSKILDKNYPDNLLNSVVRGIVLNFRRLMKEKKEINWPPGAMRLSMMKTEILKDLHKS